MLAYDQQAAKIKGAPEIAKLAYTCGIQSTRRVAGYLLFPAWLGGVQNGLSVNLFFDEAGFPIVPFILLGDPVLNAYISTMLCKYFDALAQEMHHGGVDFPDNSLGLLTMSLRQGSRIKMLG